LERVEARRIPALNEERRLKLCRRCQAPRDKARMILATEHLQLSRRWKMPSHDAVASVMEFLGSYRNAFESYDTEAILDHFIFPCTIMGDAEAIKPSLLQTKEELRPGVKYVLSLHREIGYRSGQLLRLDITELSPRLTAMTLRSRMHGENDKPLYEFQGYYSLAHTAAGCRIMAITHNQIPRLLACAGRASVPIS
jgi:hypothetical protein